MVLTAEVEAWWREQLQAVYGEEFSLPRKPGLEADGTLTRGQWLNNTYAEVVPEPTALLLLLGGCGLKLKSTPATGR
jgi:hypothetical protein